jgi:hypothetical protein
MDETAAAMVAEIEAIIEHNARCLGEAPDVGVHVLRDGRVRVYDLEAGWRKQPYREYRTLQRALNAAEIARDRAARAARLIEGGVDKLTAVATVTRDYAA